MTRWASIRSALEGDSEACLVQEMVQKKRLGLENEVGAQLLNPDFPSCPPSTPALGPGQDPWSLPGCFPDGLSPSASCHVAGLAGWQAVIPPGSAAAKTEARFGLWATSGNMSELPRCGVGLLGFPPPLEKIARRVRLQKKIGACV